MQEAMKATRLGFTAGTIDMESLNAFERLLFRATRGNMYLRYADVGTVTDPNTNKEKEKAVFVVFYAGERAKLKVTKACPRFLFSRQIRSECIVSLVMTNNCKHYPSVTELFSFCGLISGLFVCVWGIC
jgi:hypothetical protein